MDCNFPNSTFISTKPALSLSARRLPPKLQIPRSKPSRLKKRLVVNKASGGANESDSGNGFVSNPSKIFMQEAIGAEYGEGFETFRMDGPLKVDVDYLNENLQGCFLQRIRHAMKPDEAFGLIFSWDNVVADTRTLKLDAWRQLALEMGIRASSLDSRRTQVWGRVHRRSLAGRGPGSYPPRCVGKCGRCSPCRAVRVTVPPGMPVMTEYYPVAWRCKCGNRLYIP